jgi:hypothetical protein
MKQAGQEIFDQYAQKWIIKIAYKQIISIIVK